MKKNFFIGLLAGLVFFVMGGNALAADRYWVPEAWYSPGGGDWNDTAHWSDASGGSRGFSVPTASDNVFFDSNSFTDEGQAVLFPSAASTEGNRLILNFTGEDGAITWTEEAQGLTPDYSTNSQIESNTLKLSAWNEADGNSNFAYSLPEKINSDFNLSFDFWLDPMVYNVDTASNFILFVYDEWENSTISMGIKVDEFGDQFLEIFAQDSEGTGVDNTSYPISLSTGFWHQGEISVIGRDIEFIIDGVVQASFTAGIDNPFFVSDFAVANSLLSEVRIDSVILSGIHLGYQAEANSINMTGLTYPITMDSVNGTDYWEISVASGTVTLQDTTLVNSHAVGGATFNAYTTDGNVDGGGNEGWNFSNETYWIGDGGEWTDTAHWSTTSGGEGGASVPDVTTNVVFDANSFTQAGQSILFPPALPVEDPQLILNFTGEDGTTGWTEEAQGLEPMGVLNAVIDSDTLKMTATGEGEPGAFAYLLPTAIDSDFNFSFDFSFNTILDYSNSFPVIGASIMDMENLAIVTFGVTFDEGENQYIMIDIIDREGNVVYYDLIPSTLVAGTFYTLEMETIGRDINISINGNPVGGGTFEATVDNPLAGVNLVQVGNYHTSDAWVDNVSLSTVSSYQAASSSWDMTGLAYPITMDSTNGTDYWELSVASGTVAVQDTTLVNSHAVGGATFNAYTADGNVDGGGNTGWNFSDPNSVYWVGDGGNWTDTDHWSSTSGGAGGASVPSSTSNVFFDANSFTQTGQSILFPPALPAEDPQLILNFTGEDGTTGWTEEAQGLEPTVSFGSVIDANALKMVSPGGGFPGAIQYDLPTAIDADFNFSLDFSFDTLVSYLEPPGLGGMIEDADGNASFAFSLHTDAGLNQYMFISLLDRDGNSLYGGSIPSTLAPNIFHNLEMTVSGRDIVISIDEEVLGSFEAIIDNPLAGIDSFGVGNYFTTDAWVDNVNLSAVSSYQATSNSWDMTGLAYPITMDSTNGTDYWELSVAEGEINAYDTTLINSHAVGGADFYALISNNNVNGGGNEGWDFGVCTEVWTAEDLNNVRNDLTGCYEQMADIDMTDYPDFEPIGMVTEISSFDEMNENEVFNGSYDGGGFEITNLNEVLFGIIGASGTVENIVLPDVFSDGSNPSDFGELFGTTLFDLKGIAFINLGLISDCEIVGRAENGTDNTLVGIAMAFLNQGVIERTFIDGETLNQPENTDAYAAIGITIMNFLEGYMGEGSSMGIVRTSYMHQQSDWQLTTRPEIDFIAYTALGTYAPYPSAGMVVFNTGLVENCYLIFDVVSTPDSIPTVMGTVGLDMGDSEETGTHNVYIAGNFSGDGTGYIMNALGTSFFDSGEITQSVFDSYHLLESGITELIHFFAYELSGQTYTTWEEYFASLAPEEQEAAQSLVDSSDLLIGSPRTDEQLKTQANFENWDFEDIWYIDEGNAYPIFRWAMTDDPEEPEEPEEPVSNSITLNDITDITKESLKLEVEVEGDFANQELDFTAKIYNKDEEETDHEDFTATTNSEGEVTLAIEDLESKTDYRFSVNFSEHNQNDFSDYSNTKDATTEGDIEEDCTPTKLKATAVSTSQINLTWKDNCQTEKGYLLERKVEEGSFETVAELEKNKEDYQDDNLSPDTEYIYRVKAFQGDRFSDYSNEAEAKTLGEIITPPEEEEEEEEENEDLPLIEEEEEEIPLITDPTEPTKTFTNSLSFKKVTGALKSFGLLTGAIVSLASTPIPLFGTAPTPFSGSPFSKPFSLFGFLGRSNRKRKDLGFVFDEETKKPIPGAVVTIFDKDGRKIDSVITDYIGRYGFLATEGDYTIQISKKGYELKTDDVRDEFYGDLYTGGTFQIREGNIIETNIAMKSLKTNWKSFAERRAFAYYAFLSVISKDFFIIIFYLGFIVALSNLYFFPPTLFDKLIVLAYALVATYQIFFKGKSFGTIINKANKPIPFSVISLYEENNPDKRVAFTVSNALGQYYLSAKEGYYRMKVQGQELSGKAFNKNFRVYAKKGIVKKNLVMG